MIDARQVASLASAARMIGQAADSSRVWERDGVILSVVPAAPSQPLANMVTAPEPDALVPALDWIASTYCAAGIRAWRVYDTGDNSAALLRSGYRHSGSVPAMSLDLADITPPAPDDCGYESGDMAALGAINAAAYDQQGEGLDAAFRIAPPGLHIYCARHRGAYASVLSTIDTPKQDVVILFLATLPAARRRGLARRLMAAALAEARTRGCATSSLQAQPQGVQLYQAFGYRIVGHVETYDAQPG